MKWRSSRETIERGSDHAQFAVVLCGRPAAAAHALRGLPKALGSDVSGTSIFAEVWDSSGPALSSTGQSLQPVDQDYATLRALCGERLTVRPPAGSPPTDVICWAQREIPLVAQLALRPNAHATWSWMSALSNAGRVAAKLGPEQLVLISRPDVYWAPKSLKALFELAARQEPGVICTPARPTPHMVLPVPQGHDLPIDHWWCGRSQDLAVLGELVDWVQHRAPSEGELPLVNEFVIGGFLHHQGKRVRPVVAPYLLSRGDFSEELRSAWAYYRFLVWFLTRSVSTTLPPRWVGLAVSKAAAKRPRPARSRDA